MCCVQSEKIYRKWWFVKKAIFNEDMLYAAKVIQNGESIYYNAEARVIHSHNYNFMQQFHRNFDMAVSQAEHPEIFEGISLKGRYETGKEYHEISGTSGKTMDDLEVVH